MAGIDVGRGGGETVGECVVDDGYRDGPLRRFEGRGD